MERIGFIGSSDAAAVLGLSRWKTPLQIWAEKTGQVVPDDISDKEAVIKFILDMQAEDEENENK
jgi:predicted phage-related endonuclease